MDSEKKIAAKEAIAMVKDGMVLGLGSGSTAYFMIESLGERVKNGLSVVGVPSSDKTAKLAQEYNIPLTTLNEVKMIDVNIDGADEFDPELRLIKGGGGALLREKLIAYNSKTNIIIADSSKYVDKLGKFKLPIEVIPFSKNSILLKLEQMGLKPILRKQSGKEYRTDENNVIIDVDIFEVKDLESLNHTLIQIPGVVETGLFLGIADMVIMGKGEEAKIFKKEDL
nr:ribose-5-phosphate isomerase RpiA [Allomuricauda sp.]